MQPLNDVGNTHATSEGVNRRLSQSAFRRLAEGKVINEYRYTDGDPQPNPLYDELFKEQDRYYKEAYANMGLELVQRSGFFYIRELASPDREDGDQDSGLAIRRIQGVLLVLGRGVLEGGHIFDLLSRHDAGVSTDILKRIDDDPTMAQILRACGVEQPLPDAVKKHLADRDIGYFNTDGNFVLAPAGLAFFEDIFAQEANPVARR